MSAKTLERPGLARALAGLRAGDANALLVAKLDRLTRSVRDLDRLLTEHFGERGSDLVSVAESIDTLSAPGRLVLTVLVSVPQWEREATGERTAAALGHLRDRGAGDISALTTAVVPPRSTAASVLRSTDLARPSRCGC